MPTNFLSGMQRSLVAFLIALLVLPPTSAFAFGHKKKKQKTVATGSGSPLTQDQQVLQALNRLTFGPRPGDVAAVEAMGLDKWIDQQLNPETIDDGALQARLADYPAMQLDLHELTQRFPSPAMIRQAEFGKRGLPGDPVERAIYRDQIAVFEQRQQAKKEQQQQQVAGNRAQVAGMDQGPGMGDQKGNGAEGQISMKQDDMAPPPPPDMMPAPGNTVTAAAPAPPIAQVENKLYADLASTSVVTLPPEERMQKLLAMQPDEFRDFLQHLNRQDRVLLLWRHRFVQDKWGWELPGGLIDEGEEPSETAVRELEEETGYRAARVEHLITFQPMVGMVDSEHVVFTGRDPEKVGEPTEANEIERMEWVPLGSVPGLIAAGEIWNSGTLVALLRLLMPQG